MEVVTGAMSTLLPKMGDLLKEEYGLQKDVRGEIMFLKAELESMQAALLEVSEASIDQPPDILVKLWARDVKELSYDVEDTIDAFMVRVGARAPMKVHGLRDFINRSLNLLTKADVLHKIGTDIKDIKRGIMEVSERRVRYKVDNVVAKPVGPTIDSLRLSVLNKKATELVGTEEKSDGLIKRLMEGDEASKQQLKIVSIVGFGGLGKTTLANVVYQKLKVQFDCGAFIYVSLNPNMEKIFKNMLHQLGKHSNIDDEAQLINELREFLRNRRYFVVLDDIWNNYVWERIKYALIENECGSRIITTTRIFEVAKHVGGVYQLEPLSPVDSRKLFYQRIFGVEDECPHNQLAEVSERVLKKCGGVPLAIITIASLLASKKEKENTQKHWSKVCQSIGSGLDDSFDVNNMRRIFSISYYDLPPHLKTCLLYLSLYPEDYVIHAEALIWKWIGEGFVHNEQGKRLQEVGEDYLDALINKSLIQPVDITRDNKAETCRVHDMVLDLIRSLSNEEHFLITLGGQQPVTVPTKIRRLSLQTSNEADVKQLSTMSLSHVRSLTMFQEDFCLLPALWSFPVLRALDLHGCRLVENRYCKDICNLFHLRYLNLSRTSISEIPKEIGNLLSLQVLDISKTEIEELPSTFVQLRQLVYLHVDWPTRLPDGFGNLKCLQKLLRINIRSPTMLHDLGRLTELRHLEIVFYEWDERYEEPFLQCLSNLVSLEILYMSDCCGGLGSRCENLSPGPQLLRSIDISYSTIHTVPRWMSSLSSLSYLAIKLKTLGVEDLHVLGGIPSLGDLDIEVEQPTDGRDERLIIGSGYPFRCLRKLRFLSDTMEVVFAQGAMQKLQTFELGFGVREVMDRLGDFDFGLENLSSLKHASVEMWSSEAEPWEVEAAEAAIRRALDMNPNNPTLELKMSAIHTVPRWNWGDDLIEDVQSGKEEVHEEDTKQQEEVSTEMHLARVHPFLQGGMEAPISASLGAMGSLLGKLDVLLAPEYRLPKEAKDGIQLFRGDLQEIATSLVDLSEAEDPPLTSKCWMKDVRELSYDIEDYVDELLHSGADAKPGTVHRVSVFRSHVQEAIQRHERYNLGDCISRRRHLSVGPMLPTEYTETDDLFDGPTNELLKWLINEKEQQLKVVSIVGSGGLGKTTLARKLYHILGGFDCRAFLHTSQKPDMKRLLGGMLSQLRHHHQPPDACEVPELIHTIRTHLHDKRYLIVIDDLWATSLWNSISHAFPEGNHCSRIITTTQIEEVALTCCSYHQEYIFKMQRLNMDQSRKLFFKRVFGSEDDCPQQFRGISLGIIKRCGGLPLAIISIASLLASQPVLLMEQWVYIHDSLLASNLKISTSEGMRQVLNLSYDNLPHFLKTCLLYLNTYPEDYTILKDDLVKQWVAEGFINAIEGQDVEEVAESYFDELVNRRMIQPMDTNYKHEVFMVHGMLLDLIAYKSMEENFSTAVDYSQNTIGLCDKVRRLSCHFGSAKYAKTPASIGLSQVRSLAFFGLFKSMPPITEFNLLRVLILQIWGDCGGTSVDLTRICELHQLRYLQIACDVSIEIPNLMQRLQCLETVEIYARLTTVPLDIVHLPRLLHLCLPGETNLLGSVGHMRSLRRLGYIDLSSNSVDTVHSLGELTNLRDLHLACCTLPSDHLESNMRCLGSILGKLSNLKSLTLVSTSSRANILVPCDGLSFVSPVPSLLERLELLPRICIFSSLPEWIGGLGELCTLKIAVKELRWNDVDTLKRLSTLTILSLCVREAPLQRITFHSMEFPVLRYFKFRCREACLTFEEGAMPNLRRLKLGFNAHGAEQHSRMPTGLENLLSLDELTAQIGYLGATESDRRAAESALTTMIGVHRRCPGVNIFWVDWIFNLNESISRRTQKEGSRILEEEHGILEIEPGQEYGIAQRDEKQKYYMDEEGDARISMPSGSTTSNFASSGTIARSGAKDGSRSSRASLVKIFSFNDLMLGWLLSPIIGLLLNKILSYLGFDASQKLRDLEIHTIPELKRALREVEEQRMLRAVRKESSNVDILNKLATMLRSALYEAEDILDLIDYHQIEKVIGDGESHITSFQEDGIAVDSFLPTIARWNLKKRIEKLENTVTEVQKSHLLNQERSSAPNYIANMNRRSIRSIAARKVFGRDKERNMITNMLREEPDEYAPSSSSSKCYSAIGIYGIAGSGKTTLAEYVCDYEKEAKYFSPIMCIHVSETFRVEDIFHDMLEEIMNDRHSDITDPKVLKARLQEQLRDRRFLLVLDDLWDVNNRQELEELLSPLNVGRRGSKILVTSRRKDAPLVAQRPIAISDLSEEQYLSMFMHYALDDTSVGDREYIKIGREIVKNLHKSPIAAVTVAGQLCRNPDLGFWGTVANLDLLNQTMGALWWSYQQLDVDVRRCFEYCSIFPRRYELEQDKLVQMWIAQGFVKATKASEDIEDVGRSYFRQLQSCSFLQQKRKISFDICSGEYFTVHDLLHELAVWVAGSDCFKIVRGIVGQISHDVRHLCIESDGETVLPEQIFELKNLRTLIVRCPVKEMSKEDFERVFMSLRKLRVVHLELRWLETIPGCIGQLKHLRYLDIFAGGPINMTLPAEFTKLYHLRVLSVPPRTHLHFSSEEKMTNLINLRYVHTGYGLNFPDVGRLTSLQNLYRFHVRNKRGYEIQQLEHLNKLVSLSMEGLENVKSKEEALQAKLAGKKHLTELMLRWGGVGDKRLREGSCSPEHQAEVLEGLHPPSQITSLSIDDYGGLRYPSWLSGDRDSRNDPALQNLMFWSCNGSDVPPRIGGFFVRLCTLTISYCSWNSLPANMDRLTSLEELEIQGCPNIQSLPKLPQSLKKFTLINSNRSLTESCQMIGHPNWQKISHIDEKIIFPKCRIPVAIS